MNLLKELNFYTTNIIRAAKSSLKRISSNWTRKIICKFHNDKHCVFHISSFCNYPDCNIMKDYNTKIKSPNISVYSQGKFDYICSKLNLNDDNVEESDKDAFISIIGTEDCLTRYLDEPDTVHYFKDNHTNVCNLEFDDLSRDFVTSDGYHYKAMTDEQAKALFKFIESNLGKNFTIHCRAGKSRSAAVGQFIKDFYPEQYSHIGYDWSTPNKHVYQLLSHEYYMKYGFESGEIEK